MTRVLKSPGWSKDDFDAQLEGRANQLWLAKSGVSKNGELRLQVLSFRSGKWTRLPGSPRTTTDTAVVMSTLPDGPSKKWSAPCVGDTSVKREARVRCFVGKSWKPLLIPADWRASYIQGLSRRGNSLVLLLRKNVLQRTGGSISRIAVFTSRGGNFAAKGPVLTFGKQAVPRLVQTEPGQSAPIGIGITTTTSPASRWIAWLTGTGWKRQDSLPRRVGGSALSGPVLTEGRLLFPINQSDFNEGDYLFGVMESRVGSDEWVSSSSSPFNTGFGSAQGQIYLFGKHTWATWSELKVGEDSFGKLFPTKHFAARLDKDGDIIGKERLLWQGETIFPATSDIAYYRSSPVFLFMRQWSKSGGMHATVEMRTSP